MNDRKRAILFGMASAFIVWAVFTLADTIDELVIDQSCVFGGIVFLASPIVMLIIYIRHYLRFKPNWKRLILWFLGYIIVFIPMWIVIFDFVNKRKFFIPQEPRGSFIDLNGIEYMFFGGSALIAFVIFCVIFHLIYFIIRQVKKNKRQELYE